MLKKVLDSGKVHVDCKDEVGNLNSMKLKPKLEIYGLFATIHVSALNIY